MPSEHETRKRTVDETLRRVALLHATKHDVVVSTTTSEAHSDTNDAATLASANAHSDAADVTTLAAAVAHDTDALLSTSDITTNNVSSTKHGFAPKSPADATKFLNAAATPAYAQVKDSDLSTSDITTNNVSTAKHGFTPKLPNDATKYLDGTGAYSVPAGSGGGGALPTFPTISNLELRLSAELSTMTVDPDGRVSQINDYSGSWGSNFTAGGNARPRLVGNGMARLRPGLVFDGANAKLVAGATKTIAQPLTIVAVVMNWKGGANNNNLLRDSGGGPVLFHSGGNSWAIFAGTSLGDTGLYAQNTAMLLDGDIGAPAVAIAVFNGATSTIYNNGVASTTAAAGATGISGTMYVGGDSTTSYAHMVLYELLIYGKVLNGTELGQVNTYYATALGLHL